MQVPQIKLSGDCAVTVEYGQVIDPSINAKVFSLMDQLEKQAIPGIVEMVPTYRSLTIHYDPSRLLYRTLRKILEETFPLVTDSKAAEKKVVEVPVLYGGEAGPDLSFVAEHCGKTEEEVIRIHSSKDYLIYMMGFLPGFTYLGGMDPSIACPRLETPRTRIPAGSVGIAGTQTGAYSVESPGGWQIIGRTPLSLFTPESEPPILLKAGQYVRFVPISQEEFDRIEKENIADSGKESRKGIEIENGLEKGTGKEINGISEKGTENGIKSVPEIRTQNGVENSVSGIQILQPGLFTTIQDLGRTGYQQYGVPVSGAMDRFSCQLANLLVGNSLDAAVMECTLLGPSLSFDKEYLLAITGAEMTPLLNGQPVPMNTAFVVHPGDELTFSFAKSGCRSYIAFAGGLDVPVQMGSRSTYAKVGLGGLHGRKLQTGDHLTVLPIREGQMNYEGYQWKEDPKKVRTLRVILGPQEDEFTAKGMETFLSSTFTVTDQSDRMGYRLQSEDPSQKIQHVHDGNIVSDGMALGSIQVPPSGQPIIMLADRQTTGGYPKIATVCSVDLKILAQTKPGDQLRFQILSIEEAQQLYLQEKALLKEIEEAGQQWAQKSSKVYQIRVNGQTYLVHVKEVVQ